MAEESFDVEVAWEQLRVVADKMSSCSDSVVYDALKISYDQLVAKLRAEKAPIPTWVLENSLVRTQFLPKGFSSSNSEAVPEEMDVFGIKTKVPVRANAIAEEETAEVFEKPTPEQLANADRLLREARVFQMRGNRDEAVRLLKEAEAAAPGASTVLEALGDEFLAARKFGEARRYYDRARKVDPTNLSADRKYADSVFRTDAAVHQYDPSLDSEVMANAKSAAILSFIMPGLGQIVRGQIVKGVIFMAGFLIFSIVAVKMGVASTILQIVSPNAPKSATNPLAWVFTGLSFLLYFANVIDISSGAKVAALKNYNRPVPPENLPFE